MDQNSPWAKPQDGGAQPPSGISYSKPSPAAPSADASAAPQPGYGPPQQPEFGSPQQPAFGSPSGPGYGAQPGYGAPGQPGFPGGPAGAFGAGAAAGLGAPAAPGYGAPGFGGAGTPGYGLPPGYGATPQFGPPDHMLAEVWPRIAARLIDLGLGCVFVGLLFFLGMGVFFGGVSAFESGSGAGFGAAIAVMFGLVLLFGLVGLLYEWVLVAVKGATLGKMAMGIRVVRGDGSLPGWGGSFVRYIVPGAVGFLASLLSGGILGWANLIVYASFMWDNRRQGWHDKAAKTFVVRTR